VILDIAILAAVGFAAVVSLLRGLVQPLLVEGLFLGTLIVLVGNESSYGTFMSRVLHANPVFDVFLALVLATVAAYAGAMAGRRIARLPAVRGPDGFFGVFLHVGIAIAAMYWLVSGLVAMDKAFAAAVTEPALDAHQYEVLRSNLVGNPITARLVDRGELQRLQAQSRTPGGAHVDSAPQLHQLETGYEDFGQPQLRTSRLTPIVMAIGQHLPRLGRYGPADLPRRAVPVRPVATPPPA
jgi:hypothetical protein